MARIEVSYDLACILLEVLEQAREDGKAHSDEMESLELGGYTPVVMHRNLREPVDRFEKKLKAIIESDQE